jgi:hypothetical protein
MGAAVVAGGRRNCKNPSRMTRFVPASLVFLIKAGLEKWEREVVLVVE